MQAAISSARMRRRGAMVTCSGVLTVRVCRAACMRLDVEGGVRGTLEYTRALVRAALPLRHVHVLHVRLLAIQRPSRTRCWPARA